MFDMIPLFLPSGIENFVIALYFCPSQEQNDFSKSNWRMLVKWQVLISPSTCLLPPTFSFGPVLICNQLSAGKLLASISLLFLSGLNQVDSSEQTRVQYNFLIPLKYDFTMRESWPELGRILTSEQWPAVKVFYDVKCLWLPRTQRWKTPGLATVKCPEAPLFLELEAQSNSLRKMNLSYWWRL